MLPQQVKPRGVISRLLPMLLGTVVALSMAELILVLRDEPRVQRQQHWQTNGQFHRLDADLIYSARPNAETLWMMDEFVESASTNSLGLRGPEPRVAELRILVLGDSKTFGHGVTDQETYPYLLEQRLIGRGLDAQVLNGGIKGYGIDQAYQLFRLRLRRLEPDILLLAVNDNDVYDDTDRPLFELEGEELVPRDPRRDRLYRSTELERAVPDLLLWSRTAALVVRFLVGASSAPALEFPDRSARFGWARKKAGILIRGLAEISRADGFRFAVVTMPARDKAPATYDWLQALGEEVPVLELHSNPDWRERRSEIFFPTDPHLTPAGNAWVAERIDRFLRTETP